MYNDHITKKERRSRKCTTAMNNSPRNVPNKIWLLYQISSLLKTPKRIFFVRSEEQSLCPCCNGTLKVIGSRKRKYINDVGAQITLIIRRLRCCHCNRIHHELPDILVPYKRHCSESIEAVLTADAPTSVTAEESTLWRWRRWFQEVAEYFVGCLLAIDYQYKYNQGKPSVEAPIRLSQSPLQRIRRLVGDATGWLARIVRPIVNLNFWVHTRSAFLS
jgi:hypothetical protein